MFPSPYGVSFILMQVERLDTKTLKYMFPSPYGVSFILINHFFKVLVFALVSYSFPSPYGVSFILIKAKMINQSLKKWTFGFRLLMEYHSFLFKETNYHRSNRFITKFPSPYGVSFILIQGH